jgi:outer membrane protein assembly factor BamB
MRLLNEQGETEELRKRERGADKEQDTNESRATFEDRRARATLSRRAFCLSSLAFGLLPVVGRAASLAQWDAHTVAPGDAWPQFRGNPQLTGVSGSRPPAGLRPLWTFGTGDGLESSAAIVDGAVYVGTSQGELLSIDLGNGALRWRYAAGAAIGESSPAVGSGLVFVGDLSGNVHAVRARDGGRAWTFKTGTEIKASPVVIGGRVLIGSYDQHFYCLSAQNGRQLWRVRTNGPVHATAGVADGVAYVTGCDEILRAVRISDGRVLFQINSGAYTGASPALLAGNAFYGTFNNEVLGVNLVSRQVGWRYQHPQRKFPYYSSPAIYDARVVLGGRDKLVHCLDAYTGREHWSFGTQARVESSPAVVGGRVYIGSNDGRLYAFDIHTGRKLGEFNAGAPVSASPAVASGRLVVGAQDGKLYCLG